MDIGCLQDPAWKLAGGDANLYGLLIGCRIACEIWTVYSLVRWMLLRSKTPKVEPAKNLSQLSQ